MTNLDTTLAQLEDAQLVRRLGEEQAPTCVFKHALTQETAYQSLLHAQQRELHRRVAQTYEALYGDRCLDDYAAILARHYGKTDDDAKTLEYATRAGDLAARVYANAEAITFYEQALDAATRGGATSEQFSHLYTKRGRVLEVMGRNPEALSTYEEMTELARNRRDLRLELQSLLLRGKLHSVGSPTFDRAKALALAEAADRLARELGDRTAQAQVMWNQLLLFFYNSEISDAIRYGEQALALARELGARELLAFILTDLAKAYPLAGQIALVPAIAAEANSIWRELDNKPMLADSLMTLGTQTFLSGDYDQVFALTEEAISLNKTIGSALGVLASQGTQLYPYLERGEFARALTLTDEMRREATESKFGFGLPLICSFSAWTYGMLGAFERGEAMAQQARAELNPAMPEFFRTLTCINLTRFYVSRDNPSAAAEALMASQVEKNMRRLDQTGLFGTVATGELYLAKGEFARTVQLMSDFVRRLHEVGIRQSLHDALYLQARAMWRLGETAQAVELLHQASDQAKVMQSRRMLWQIYAALSEIETERGNLDDAEKYRARAKQVIASIVANTPEEFRASFLNLPGVQKVMEMGQ